MQDDVVERLGRLDEWHSHNGYITSVPRDAAATITALRDRLEKAEGALRERTGRIEQPCHAFTPDPEYPWFCEQCGYPAHERLMHFAAQEPTP